MTASLIATAPPFIVHDVPPADISRGALFIGDNQVRLFPLSEILTVYILPDATGSELRYLARNIDCIFGHPQVVYVQEHLETGEIAQLLKASQWAAFFGLV